MSGISTSLQNIKSAVSDCQAALNSGHKCDDFVSDSLRNIEDETKHMTVMNVFMFESINRVLDCSKSRQGMKLVPKNETISISETLALPLSCMRELQSKIKIELLPIETSICSHVVTDKQWFQENMICLLSNAVKYSSEGEVSISISKVNSADLPSNNFDSKLELVPQENEVLNSTATPRDSLKSSRLRFSSIFYKFGDATAFQNEDFSNSDILNFSSSSSDISCLNRNLATSGLKKSRSRESVTSVSAKSNFFLLVEVQDTGIGIPQETMDELFSPFKQAQRLAGGTGLGLYSLAKRVEALNGYYGVRARSDGKQGSSFWFAIPYKPDHITSANTDTVAPLQIAATALKHGTVSTNLSYDDEYGEIWVDGYSNSKSRKSNHDNLCLIRTMTNNSQISDTMTTDHGNSGLNILLVDDSHSILKVVGKMLRKHGHCITLALNGEEALRVLEKTRDSKDMKPFDVVIIDLHMPVMDGKRGILYA